MLLFGDNHYCMVNIKDNLIQIRANIAAACASVGRDPEAVKVLAATKTVSAERINLLASCGVNLAGENRIQEFLAKYDAVKGVEWHFIGSLQTNKVKFILDKVALIHSLDRPSLADEIERQSEKLGRVTEALIEINAGAEDSKSGVSIDKLESLYQYVLQKPHIRLKGFMPVLPIGAPKHLYAQMRQIFHSYQSRDPEFCELSMGMSGDYETAIKYGATIVRLGSCIFGERY